MLYESTTDGGAIIYRLELALGALYGLRHHERPTKQGPRQCQRVCP